MERRRFAEIYSDALWAAIWLTVKVAAGLFCAAALAALAALVWLAFKT